MEKRILFLMPFLYFLALLQTSFFVHFPLFGAVPNLLLFFVVFYNLFEKPSNWSGVAAAFWAGFLADVFSSYFFGFNLLIFLVSALLAKKVFRKYVKVPVF